MAVLLESKLVSLCSSFLKKHRSIWDLCETLGVTHGYPQLASRQLHTSLVK